jgi:hypothetical protein
LSPSNKVHGNMRCVFGLVTLLLTLVAFGPSTALASGAWSAPTQINNKGVASFLVSCSSATFCVAVGDPTNKGYDALTYNGRSWSAPTLINGGGVSVGSVSCPSATFCVAVGEYPAAPNAPIVSYALTYNGKSWTAPTTTDGIDGSGGLDSVSCSSPSFCVAVGTAEGEYVFTKYALTYNGTSWSAPTQIDNSDSGGYFSSVSCPSATFCTAVSDTGYALTYNGTSWSAPTHIDTNPVSPSCSFSCVAVTPFSVSCPSATFCAAVDENGNALTYNGTSWSAPTDNSGGFLDSVSCPSATFCVAVDENGNALTYNGTSWSAPNHIDDGNASVSCPSASFCVTVSNNGDALTYTTATAGEASASVKIEKFKVTTNSLVVTIKISRAGTVTITGPGLKKTTRTVAAGTRVMTVALTKAGKAERAGRRKIKLSVSLKTSIKTVSRSVEINL